MVINVSLDYLLLSLDNVLYLDFRQFNQKMGELKKELGFWAVLFIALSSVLGESGFFLPVLGAKIAGPASIISWIVLCVVIILTGLTFAELESMFPGSGGLYDFIKNSFGRFVGFLSGWGYWLVANVGSAMLIVGAIQYLIPDTEAATVGFNIGLTHLAIPIFVVKFLLCLIIIIVFNYMAYRGIRDSAVMIITFAVINLGILIFLGTSMFLNKAFTWTNFTPFFPTINPTHNLSMIFVAIFMIAESLFGFEQILFLGNETKNPEKTIPKTMIISIIIEGTLIILFVIATLGYVNWKVFAGLQQPTPLGHGLAQDITSAPYSFISYKLFGPIGLMILSVIIYLVIMGSATTSIVTTPRLLFTMAKDKLFLPSMKEIHPVYKSPYKAIVFQTVIISIFAFVSLIIKGYETLLKVYTPIIILIFVITECAFIFLRIKHKKKERPFRLFMGIPIAIFLIIFYVGLLLSWLISQPNSITLFLMAIAFLLMGIPFFFLVEMYYDIKAIRKIHDILAYFALFTETINLPKKIINEILMLLGDLRGKSVLEYGCGVGTLTKELAKSVGRNGKVFATDLSLKDLMITENRIKKLVLNKNEIGRVHIMHDTNHTKRVHPDIHYADVAVSVGTISYADDIHKILRDMYSILPLYGKICFVEYADFFGIIPNVEWLSSNDKIYHLFKEEGFSVRVIRKRRLFWNYVYIYGYKTGDNFVKVI